MFKPLTKSKMGDGVTEVRMYEPEKVRLQANRIVNWMDTRSYRCGRREVG